MHGCRYDTVCSITRSGRRFPSAPPPFSRSAKDRRVGQQGSLGERGHGANFVHFGRGEVEREVTGHIPTQCIHPQDLSPADSQGFCYLVSSCNSCRRIRVAIVGGRWPWCLGKQAERRSERAVPVSIRQLRHVFLPSIARGRAVWRLGHALWKQSREASHCKKSMYRYLRRNMTQPSECPGLACAYTPAAVSSSGPPPVV